MQQFTFPEPQMMQKQPLPEFSFNIEPQWFKAYSQPKFAFHTSEGSWMSDDENAEMPEKYTLGTAFQGNI